MLPNHVEAAGSNRSCGTQNSDGGKPGQSEELPGEWNWRVWSAKASGRGCSRPLGGQAADSMLKTGIWESAGSVAGKRERGAAVLESPESSIPASNRPRCTPNSLAPPQFFPKIEAHSTPSLSRHVCFRKPAICCTASPFGSFCRCSCCSQPRCPSAASLPLPPHRLSRLPRLPPRTLPDPM